MIERAGKSLRETGNPRDQVFAEIIAGILRARDGKDVYPFLVTSAETEVLIRNPFLEAPIVSESLYQQISEALVREGYTFVVDIKPVSIRGLATDERTESFFYNIDLPEEMQLEVPPQIQVAINPDSLQLKGSNYKSTETQIKRIKKQEEVLKHRLPEKVRGLISMEMPKNPSILVQLDIEHQIRTGRPLLTDFGRVYDGNPAHISSHVGRISPNVKLMIHTGGYLGYSSPIIYAVPVVVLPLGLSADLLTTLLS